MIRAYLQAGHSIAKGCPSVEYEGAISFAVPGIHKNVLRFDVASLYPSVIRQYKVYPKDKDPGGLFIKMVDYFTEERLKNKKLGKETGDRYFKDLEQSQKIAINSMYGFLGAPKLNYNHPEGAAEVTRHGRRILQAAIKYISGKEYEPDKEAG
jgi:DNA polymerase I